MADFTGYRVREPFPVGNGDRLILGRAAVGTRGTWLLHIHPVSGSPSVTPQMRGSPTDSWTDVGYTDERSATQPSAAGAIALAGNDLLISVTSGGEISVACSGGAVTVSAEPAAG